MFVTYGNRKDMLKYIRIRGKEIQRERQRERERDSISFAKIFMRSVSESVAASTYKQWPQPNAVLFLLLFIYFSPFPPFFTFCTHCHYYNKEIILLLLYRKLETSLVRDFFLTKDTWFNLFLNFNGILVIDQ